MNKVKDLAYKHRFNIIDSSNAFEYKDEILYHLCDKIEFNKINFNAHIFYNEKAALEFKHYLYKAIIELEKKLKPFKSNEECQKYLESAITNKYKKYFQIKNKCIIRNQEVIEKSIFRAGVLIFILYGKKLDKIGLLESYRNRDSVEKDINSLKNYIDTKRLRAHNQYTANGRLFIKFIALIIRTKIMNVIKKDKNLKKYSINEIIAELKKLKVNVFDAKNTILTELTKKQKLIFKAFKIDIHKIAI